MYSRRHLGPLAIIALVVAGLTVGTGLVINWFPTAASKESGSLDHLMWFMFIASTVIFAIVTSVLLYSIIRFRAAPGDESDGPPIHGHTLLEIVWTAVPALLLVVAAVYSYLVLSDTEADAKGQMTVDVTAQQFAWTFTYPDLGVQSGDLRLPVGTQVKLRLQAKDVIHDFYVPQFRVKLDAVPGINTYLRFTPDRVGTYQASCNELCGAGHALMRARVIVMTKDAYAAWASAAKSGASAAAPAPSGGSVAGAGNAAAGKAFFVSTCGGCHTNGGTVAGVGPKLAGAGLTADRIRAQVTKGGAVMPPGLASGKDLDNVVAYVMSIQ